MNRVLTALVFCVALLTGGPARASLVRVDPDVPLSLQSFDAPFVVAYGVNSASGETSTQCPFYVNAGIGNYYFRLL